MAESKTRQSYDPADPTDPVDTDYQALRARHRQMEADRVAGEHALNTLVDGMLDREQQVWSLRGHVAAKDVYIHSLLADGEAKDAYVHSLLAHGEAKDAYIHSLLADGEAKDRFLANVDWTLEEKDAYIASLLSHIAAVERGRAGHESQAAILTEQLHHIEQSGAWGAALALRRLRDRLAPAHSRRGRIAARALRYAGWGARHDSAPASPDAGEIAAAQPHERTAADDASPGQADSVVAPPQTAAAQPLAAPVANAAPAAPMVAVSSSHRILIINGSMGNLERYRCDHTREQVSLAGGTCEVCDLSDPRLLSLVPACDIVIFHRTEWGPLAAEVMALARSRGEVAVLFDIDDLLFIPEIEAQVQALWMNGPTQQAMFRASMRAYRQAVETCDGLLAATDAIADAGRAMGKPAWVHRNALSQTVVDLSEQARGQRVPSAHRVVIGYASGSRTHNKDFAAAEEALEQALAAFPTAELRIIGPLDLSERWRAWRGRVSRLPLVPWRDLPEALAQFDISIAPLEIGNAFCEGKSELKYFEAAAVGVPTIASRSGGFRQAIRHGDNGYLAGNPREWFDALQNLIASPALRLEMGERARQDVLAHYTPAARAGSLMSILDDAVATRRRARQLDGPPSRQVFREHWLAHQFLDGLTGIEIGAAAHNPFRLNTRNVAPPDDYEYYADASRRLMGIPPATVDLFAYADALPLLEKSEDFILSSHVVEHLPNPIKAFVEWDRIVRDGGYVFMIVPLRDALPGDVGRELTTLHHIIDDYETSATIDTHSLDGVPGGRMGHYHVFTPDSLHTIVDWMNSSGLCRWDLAVREDVDTKVGNGFTLVYRVHHSGPHADE